MDELFTDADLEKFEFNFSAEKPGLTDWDNPTEYTTLGDDGRMVVPATFM